MEKYDDERNLDDPSPTSSFASLESGLPLLSRKVKLLTAAAIFYGNVMFGCAVNTYGPALTSFEKKYDTDSEEISRVFSVTTGGLVLGALASGFMYKFVNRQLAVIAFMGGMGAVMFLTPFCPTLTWFFVSAGVFGIFAGFYGSAQFVWIMEMMQKDCPPYVQSQHFFYALGTILATLVMAPFLDKKKEDGDDANEKMKGGLEMFGNLTITGKVLTQQQNGVMDEEDESGTNSKLFVPFTIVGSLLLVSMISHIILFLFFRYHPPPPEVNSNDKNEPTPAPNPGEVTQAAPPAPPAPTSKWPKIRMVILSCCFFGALGGMENCVIQFLPKFGQNSELGLSESDSTYVLTGLTTSYAVARFICIFIVFKVPSQVLLCGNMVISTIANILLVGWASNSLPVLWTASVLYGLGFSSAFASFSAYLERYLQVTDIIGALIMVTGSGVAAIYPLIIGSFIDEDPVVLGYTTFASIAICGVAFGISSYLTHKDKTRY